MVPGHVTGKPGVLYDMSNCYADLIFKDSQKGYWEENENNDNNNINLTFLSMYYYLQD